MNKFIILLLLSFTITPVYSQVAYQRGDNQLNFGFNAGRGPGVYISYESGITDNISIGGELGIGFSSGVYSSSLSYTYFQSNFRFNALLSYHFAQLIELPEEWDLYGGGDIGFSLWTNDSDSDAISQGYSGFEKSSFLIGVHGGGRWFWTDIWGVNAEFGGGYGYFVVKGGLTLKI